MKKLFLILFALTLLVGCGRPHHRLVHQKVRVHKTKDGHYCYYNVNNHSWYYLYLNQSLKGNPISYNDFYTGNLSDYKAAGGEWIKVEDVNTIPQDIQHFAEVDYTISPNPIGNGNIDMVGELNVEEINITITDSGEPMSTITEAQIAEIEYSSQTPDTSSDTSSFSESSSDSSSSSDSGSSDSGGSSE